MSLGRRLLPEFDREMASTRESLERVPEDRLDWKPHPRSTSLGGLATHLANLPSWTVETIGSDEFDMAPDGGEPDRVPEARSVAEAVETFDRNVEEARAALEGASDERLRGPWTLRHGRETIFTMPRLAVIRSMVLNHIIHHRAQLGVYLRLNEVPVPQIYGPTADDGG